MSIPPRAKATPTSAGFRARLAEALSQGAIAKGGPVAPKPVKAFHAEHPCQLNAYHAPTPVMTEYHHRKPVFLQNRLYGRIVYGPELWVCGNCHDAIHAWLYWLLGEHKQPPYIGRHAQAEAQRTFDWYIAEGGTVA